MKIPLRQLTFASLDFVLMGLFILISFAFMFRGIHLNFHGIDLKIHRLDNPFLIMVGLALLKLLIDPDCGELRKFFMKFGNFLTWCCLFLGALSAGLFFWLSHDSLNVFYLLLKGGMSHSRWEDGLRQYLQFYIVLFHFIWVFFSRKLSRVAPEKSMEIFRKDALILGLAILAPIFFFIFVQDDFEKTEFPFFMTVFIFPLIGALKGALLEGICPEWKSGPSRFKKILWWSIGLYVGAFTFLGIRKLDLYLGNGDFPVYLQPLWNTIHGKFMQINWFYTYPGQSEDWFGEHLNLIYFFLLAIYKFFQNARIFIFLQAFLIGLAAWPLYEIVKIKFRDHVLAFSFAFAYLASPLISRALLFDFHAEAAEPFLIFLTFLFLERGRLVPLFISSILLLTCKEDASIYLMAFGFYAGFYKKEWKMGVLCMGLGAFWLFFSLGLVMPMFNKGAHYHTLKARYGWLGTDFKSILTHLVEHPMEVLRYLFDEQSFKNFGYLLIPLSFLPVLHLSSFILILPSTLELFLSTFKFMKCLSFHYPWFICPFYYLGAVVSLKKIIQHSFFRSQKFLTALSFYVFFSSLFFHYYFEPQPGVSGTYNWYYLSPSPFGQYFDVEYYRLNDHDRRAKSLIKQWIPAEVSLSVSHRFGHDVSNRAILRMFPEARDVGFIFLDIYWDQFCSVTGEKLKKRKVRIFSFLSGDKFGVKAYDDGYLLMERGFSQDQNLKVAQALVGFFEAEAMDGVGETVVDSQAYNKRARFVDLYISPQQKIIKGYSQFFQKGPVDITVRMKVDQLSQEGEIAKIDLLEMSSNRVVLQRSIQAKDFSVANHYEDIHIHYENPSSQVLGFTVVSHRWCKLWIDHIQWSASNVSWSDLERNLKNQ